MIKSMCHCSLNRSDSRYPWLAAATLMLASVVSSCSTRPLDPATLDAAGILESMAATYGAASSYLDSGQVEEVVQTQGMTITTGRPFSIAFVRPDRFRFQFTDPNGMRLDSGRNSNVAIVWRDGDAVQSWWDLNPTAVQNQSLAVALTGPDAISRGAARHTPALLMPGEIDGPRLSGMANAVRLEDVSCGENRCFVIEGDYAGNRQRIWVDQGSFLLRRMEQDFVVRSSHYFITIEYDPAINLEVNPEQLAFNPPLD